MKKSVIVLGSTGSIGKSALLSIKNNKNFTIKLLSSNKNIKKLFEQAKKFNVKNVIIEDKKKYEKYKNKFDKNKINLHYSINSIQKIINTKVDFCVNSISGIDGLEPTIKLIPLTKNILIANKETIICAWEIINKKIIKHKTNFIPIDSEHFSIWKLIENEKQTNINKVILTASGGPFLNKSKKKLSNIKPKFALKHPNWKMGKKISIDSSNMMNKILEYIEAKKIFNLRNNQIDILIHPLSFVHAVVFFNNDLIKFLAHETKMTIPISNALNGGNKKNNINFSNSLKKILNLKFYVPSKSKFPLLKLLDLIPEKSSYFETILITLNDGLVKKYLDDEINYISLEKNLTNLIKKPYLTKFYKLKPNTIYDIKK